MLAKSFLLFSVSENDVCSQDYGEDGDLKLSVNEDGFEVIAEVSGVCLGIVTFLHVILFEIFLFPPLVLSITYLFLIVSLLINSFAILFL